MTANNSAQPDPATPPDPQVVEQLRGRLDQMFAKHMENPLMKYVHDIAVKFAEEGRIRG